ncbi:hypothetical protein HYH02_008986 [Chlamydomonas schloesseri]|uniref:Right handed beta helix domain-containing protein n=1 Tax=Chlamydomonas schloesseri TaxID=2026947 RepID=A0A836B283_9CHLO|nr:hypothetical protein HYH02_008986 [Chlamydomonas schloesseri]|eukprot:KAG2445119.1 hypothetical protein HYH02_008986 [Chlamydomonas schloesseri]
MSLPALTRCRGRQALRGRRSSSWRVGRCCGPVAATHAPQAEALPRAGPAPIPATQRAHPSGAADNNNTGQPRVGAASTEAGPPGPPVREQGVAVPRRQALLGLLAASLAAITGGRVIPCAATDAEEIALAAAGVAAAGPVDVGAAAAAPAAEVVACFVSPGGAADAAQQQQQPLPPGAEAAARFSSVAEAVAACPSGGVVLVAAGRYRERLVLHGQAVTIKAWPQGAEVELVWETDRPYESTVDISGGTSAALGGSGSGGQGVVVLEGLTIRHASKSVANNFGVYVHGACAPRLLDCDISSRTGAGVGVEGASPWLLGCRVHDCARQGLAVFGGGAELALDLAAGLSLDPAVDPGLLTGMTGGVVQGCDVYGNALDGVLVRGGAAPDLMDNKVHDNKGAGFNLQDCAGRYSGNVVYDNARGAVALSPLFELDAGDLAGSNSLRGLLRRL